MPNYLQCGRFRLALDRRPLVMGILNVTPDSFSDAGQFHALEAALSHAEQMISEGVDIIDIGGESTRPGSPAVGIHEELRRVMPVVYALRDCGKPLSVDTRNPQVMREVLAAGADMINDIEGFRTSAAVSAVKDADCALCIMHMQNAPQTMQLHPEYEDVVAEVTAFLKTRKEALQQAGIDLARMCVDPGFGFGKTLEHNLALLKKIESMQHALGLPLLAGLSRKSMIGVLTGKPVSERGAGSLAAALVAAANGARILRVHDVAATVDALKVWQAGTENIWHDPTTI